MKLVSITWSSAPRLPGLRPSDTGRVECDKPSTALEGWRAVIRGPQLFFVSPAGWNRDQSVRTRDPQGACTVFGPIPTSDVYLEWCAETPIDVAALLKPGSKIEFETPPFGWRPTPLVTDKPFLEPIPPGQTGDA